MRVLPPVHDATLSDIDGNSGAWTTSPDDLGHKVRVLGGPALRPDLTAMLILPPLPPRLETDAVVTVKKDNKVVAVADQ